MKPSCGFSLSFRKTANHSYPHLLRLVVRGMNVRGLRAKVLLTSVQDSNMRIYAFRLGFAPRELALGVWRSVSPLKTTAFARFYVAIWLDLLTIRAKRARSSSEFCLAGTIYCYGLEILTGDFGRDEISVTTSKAKIEFENSLIITKEY